MDAREGSSTERSAVDPHDAASNALAALGGPLPREMWHAPPPGMPPQISEFSRQPEPQPPRPRPPPPPTPMLLPPPPRPAAPPPAKRVRFGPDVVWTYHESFDEAAIKRGDVPLLPAAVDARNDQHNDLDDLLIAHLDAEDGIPPEQAGVGKKKRKRASQAGQRVRREAQQMAAAASPD